MKTDTLKGSSADNQYQNLTFLTPGGMGDVYVADDTINNTKVAIKVIRITSDELRLLLEEEFKIAISLKHDNIVTTYYYGEFSDSTGNYFYSVMEYISKGSLLQKLSTEQASISIDDSLGYFYDLLKGLSEAHKTIIHRDLKPGNILVDENCRLKICDFGIAKYVDHLTRTKTLKGYGTFPYMSPECWMRESNSREMDIYSLGIIFFQILTLQLPFKGPAESDFKEQHLFSGLPQILDIRSEIPITVIEIIRKMTNKRPSDRYSSVEEVIAAFDKILEQPATKSLDVSSLLTKVHKKISAAAEAELKEKQAREVYNEKQKVLNYSIHQLFIKFSTVADAINNLSDSNQVILKKSIAAGNASASSLSLSFMGKSIRVSFYNQDIIPNYIKERKKSIIEHQVNTYGMVLDSPRPEYIETDNVVLLGKVEIYGEQSAQPGFNVALRKRNEEDIYGEWWACKFSHMQMFSNVSNDFYFSFEPLEFFKEYEYGRGRVMHKYTLIFKEVDEKDILDLVERIV